MDKSRSHHMHRRRRPRRAGAAAAGLMGVAALALAACPDDAGDGPDADEVLETEAHDVRLEVVADDFEHPWSMAFLSDDEALVTERPGRLSRVDLESGGAEEIGGVPQVAAINQGGLLDVALHPDFEDNPRVYLTYAAPGGGGAATRLGRGRLVGDALEDFEVLFTAEPYLEGGRHFGSRIVFDDDGYLFVTVGDRAHRDLAQDTGNAVGATLRFEDDGGIPDDNPFVGEDGVEPAIYSYGHRNVQGMAVHPDTGAIWQNEHGPSGGDEINRLQEGQNFGWPIATYGVEYDSGAEIGDAPHERDGVADPLHHWGPGDSYAPSGAAFYDGDRFPGWRGDLFMGALALEHLGRFPVDGGAVGEEEALFEEFGWRVRDVRVSPDGFLYVLVDAGRAPIVRIVPAG